MKRYFSLFLLVFFLFSTLNSIGQELMANVTIDATQLPNMQTSVVTDMKQTITRFLNERKWSNDEYLTEERIRCNFSIMLTSGNSSDASYSATLQVQATRPVYGTSYETITMNFFDKNFNFQLNLGQPIIYNDNMFTTDLSSMLAFYANIILALDADSFGKLGGQSYVEKAYTIANNAVEAGGGWVTSGDPNNRYALIYNLNGQQLLPFRNQFYIYHREVLDNYLKDPDGGRLKILAMLKVIKDVSRLVPYSILLRTFFLSKRDELINIFSDSKNDDLKNQAFDLLKQLDALNTERYSVIIK
jgi:hypothetical protein